MSEDSPARRPSRGVRQRIRSGSAPPVGVLFLIWLAGAGGCGPPGPDGEHQPASIPEPPPPDRIAPRTSLENAGKSRVVSVAAAPDGMMIAAKDLRGRITLWDPATGAELAVLEPPSITIGSIVFSPDGQALASSDPDGTVALWDVAARHVTKTFRGYREPDPWCDHRTESSTTYNGIAFSPDGNSVALGSGDHDVSVWDVTSGRKRHVLKGHTNWVLDVAFAPDGRCLATASWDGTVKLWDLTTGREVSTLRRAKPVFAVAFAPDGRTLATSGLYKVVDLWDLPSGRLRATLENRSWAIWALAISPDGRTLAAASDDGTIKLWDIDTRKAVAVLVGHEYAVSSVAFAPDGRWIASGGIDGTVKLWGLPKR